MIRDEIHVAMYSKHVSCDVGFKGPWGNVFFESVRVNLWGVGVGRSVCFGEKVWVLTLRELEFGQFHYYFCDVEVK